MPSQKNDSRHTQIVLIFGLFAVALIFVITSFVGSLFGTSDSAASTATSNSSSSGAGYDPLVTIPPKGVQGGQIQPLSTDPSRGAEDPVVTIIEFGDFQCPDCAAMSETMDQILQRYRTVVRQYWKDYPIPSVHPQAETAAMAARCAARQNAFWEYHHLLFLDQDLFPLLPWTNIATELELDVEAFDACLASNQTRQLVTEGYFIGQVLEVSQTPTYYINGEKLSGPQTYEELAAVIEEKLAEAGVAVPPIPETTTIEETAEETTEATTTDEAVAETDTVTPETTETVPAE